MRNGKTITVRKILAVLLGVSFVFLVGLPYAQATTPTELEMSYHGTLGHLLTEDVTDHEQGMLEKWCALPDLNIADDGFVGDMSWTARCGGCHIGGKFGALNVLSKGVTYTGDPAKPDVDCFRCHVDADSDMVVDMPGEEPTNSNCMTCHGKEKAKRGLDLSNDVHMVGQGMLCQDCHVKFTDDDSDHQLAKGTCIDTTLRTAWGSQSDLGKDCAGCHGQRPHKRAVRRGSKLDRHCNEVACETCHTGLRAGYALESRSWASGYNVDVPHGDEWLPVHKWYDGNGPSEDWPASGHLPILGPADMRNNPGAKIYPFNDIEATWWIKDGSGDQPALDHVIPLTVVRAACAFFGHTPTDAEMQTYDGDGIPGADYPNAALMVDKVCFNVSHSVVPKEDAFNCKDCHGPRAFVLDWEALGYDGDAYD